MKQSMVAMILAAAAGGCSLGARYQPGLDERVGPAITFSLATEGLLDEASSTTYGRLTGSFHVSRDLHSEEFPGEEDDWTGLGLNVEGGAMLHLAGTDKRKWWMSLGAQAGFLNLVRSTQVASADGDSSRWESESETHFGGGPMFRIGYGWVHEKSERPKGHCQRCHDETDRMVKRRLHGPEIGIGYVWFADLGSAPVVEFTFLNLFF